MGVNFSVHLSTEKQKKNGNKLVKRRKSANAKDMIFRFVVAKE